MRRREFITLLVGVAGWPLAARAQQSAMPVIGFLSGTSPGAIAHLVAAFHQGLKDAGYVEAESVAIEYRWAQGQYNLLPTLAADLVNRHVAVIAALGPPAVLAAKAATSTIPIVFTSGGDVVKSGLVASLNRPGGNATGVNLFTQVVEAKKLELLGKLTPITTTIAFLINPENPAAEGKTKEMQEAARGLGRQLHVLNASTESEVDAAFVTLVQQQVGALVVAGDPFFDDTRRGQLVALAARHSIPAIYGQREYAADGGLMSYGTSLVEVFR
jgi:putative tryptophan/tyrosine transport system substrate-binding protein